MNALNSENRNLQMKAKADFEAGRELRLKLIVHHLTEAIAFCLKQNLLGNDINLEFLVLSIKVLVIESTCSLVNWFQQPNIKSPSTGAATI